MAWTVPVVSGSLGQARETAQGTAPAPLPAAPAQSRRVTLYVLTGSLRVGVAGIDMTQAGTPYELLTAGTWRTYQLVGDPGDGSTAGALQTRADTGTADVTATWEP